MDLPEAANEAARPVVEAAFTVHREMGPGLLESIYESCLVKELQKRNVRFERQKSLPVHYFGELIDEKFRLDLMVEDKVVIEVKAVEALLPIHEAQLLTYLKLTGCEIGLLINFNVRLIKDGIQRVVLSKKIKK
ncbi:MAG TPA: GxxExxY protein [bacterium]|nr:GxxExxY protein [bacterium]